MNKNALNLKLFWVNILLAMGVGIVLIIAVVVWMRHYTDHGHEIEVPQVTGLYPTEATSLLSSTGLYLEIIDSTFSKKVPLGTIVEQNPPVESKVKEGRTIYVVINASAHRQVVLPELHDMSWRQAVNMLHQLGLQVGDILYEPSEYRDLVLDLRVDSVSLETGTKVNEGTVITVVVGCGRGTEVVNVPDMAGMRLMEARSMLLAKHLTLGRVEYDIDPAEENKEEYVVYCQQPQSGSSLLEGSAVHIKLSQDKAKVVTENNITGEDDFF